MKQSIRISIGIVALVAPLLLAQEARRPNRTRNERATDEVVPQRSPGEFGRNRAPTTAEVATDEQVRDFMKQYSPKRWARYESDVPEERKEHIRRAMSTRFQQIKRLQTEHPALFEILIKRLPVEDEIFAIGWELSHDSPPNRDELHAKLAQQVRSLLMSRLDERKARLTMLQQRLEQESADLKSDETNLESDVDSTVSSIENDKKWPAMDFGAGLRHERRNREQSASAPAVVTPSEEQP